MLTTLRTHVLATAAFLAMAFAAQSAMAAATVNIPFNFMVGNTVCPAGQYMIHQDQAGRTVALAGNAKGFLWFAHPGNPTADERRVVLSFDKLGTMRALRTVQYGSQVTARLDGKYAHARLESEQIVAGQ